MHAASQRRSEADMAGLRLFVALVRSAFSGEALPFAASGIAVRCLPGQQSLEIALSESLCRSRRGTPGL